MSLLRTSIATFAIVASVAACASSSPTPDAATEPSATESAIPVASSAPEASASAAVTASAAAASASAAVAPPAEPKGVCDPSKGAQALASFARTKPFLDKIRKEEHPSKEEWDGNMALLLSAAEAGLLDAQYEYGKTLFGARFTDHAPKKSEEADYVRALQFVRAAAVRGHEPAGKMLPELALPTLPAKLAAPLQDVPRDWVVKAGKSADAWIAACGPKR